MAQVGTRAIGRIQSLSWHRMRPGFDAVRINTAALRSDPFLNVDHFRMSEPIFPPHPHAGFSAITYIFEDSRGSCTNRDSSGHSSVIRPGGVHWTMAGSGIMHEEIPLNRGEEMHGLQIFLNLPLKDKTCEPQGLSLQPSEVACAELPGGARVRVVAGEVAGVASPFNSRVLPKGVVILDIHLPQPGASFHVPLPPDFNATAILVKGSVEVGGRVLTQDEVCDFEPPSDASSSAVAGTAAGAGPAQLVLLAGPPLGDPVVWQGPFCGSSPEQVAGFYSAYQAGRMGSLQPTPGAFSAR